jgi:galactose oxidase
MISLPLVAAAGFVVPTSGNILTFSADQPKSFGGSGNTWTATYNPSSGAVSQLNVQNTQHDMFCPGISMDVNGRAVVTGGDDEQKTSIYVASSNQWISAANMKKARGYQSTATCSDGRIFNIGGSWSGGEGGKDGEIYNPSTNTWTSLPNCPVAPMLTNDAQGVYRADNHAWLFGWKNGYVFQAGPSKLMNWYGTSGTGSRASAGPRADAADAMCGNAVMYDAVAGKIVTFGGSPSYQNSPATKDVFLITLGTPPATPSVQRLTSMAYSRAFGNAVVLPNGKVFVAHGQPYPVPFTDTDAVLTPELWDPATQTFTTLPAETAPRTYHSIALLMLDGRVFSTGGGLCGDCNTNHFDAQIYSPAYLFNSNGTPATRPVINSISTSSVRVGNTFYIDLNSAATSFSMIRYGSSTHTVNTDQRRIPLTPISTSGTRYTFRVPSDSGIALPGYWMVFAINSQGTPSVARSIRVTV